MKSYMLALPSVSFSQIKNFCRQLSDDQKWRAVLRSEGRTSFSYYCVSDSSPYTIEIQITSTMYFVHAVYPFDQARFVCKGRLPKELQEANLSHDGWRSFEWEMFIELLTSYIMNTAPVSEADLVENVVSSSKATVNRKRTARNNGQLILAMFRETHGPVQLPES